MVLSNHSQMGAKDTSKWTNLGESTARCEEVGNWIAVLSDPHAVLL